MTKPNNTKIISPNDVFIIAEDNFIKKRHKKDIIFIALNGVSVALFIAFIVLKLLHL